MHPVIIPVSENSGASVTNPSAAAEALPDYSGYVNDYTGTLSSEWKNKSEQLVQKVQTDTGCEIAVAVVESLDGVTIEEYALKLFEKWGIGKKDRRQRGAFAGFNVRQTIKDRSRIWA